MKKILFGIVWLFILLVCSIESYSFICTVDGGCFMECMEKQDNFDYCKIKCTTCGW